MVRKRKRDFSPASITSRKLLVEFPATDLMAPPKPSWLAVPRTQSLKQCRSFGIFFFFRSQRHWQSAGAEGFVGPARRGFLEEDDSTLLPVNYSLLRRAEGLPSLEGCVKLDISHNRQKWLKRDFDFRTVIYLPGREVDISPGSCTLAHLVSDTHASPLCDQCFSLFR